MFCSDFLDHSLDKLVNLLSTVTCLATFQEVHKLGLVRETTTGTSKLERPQEVVGLLEVWPNSVNFMNEVSTTLDSNRSNTFLNNRVISDGNALFVELAKSTLVNELLDSRSGGVTIGDIRLNKTKHTDGRFVKLDKGSVVDLTKAEELHDLLGLGGDSDGTPDADDQGELWHGGDIESALRLGLTAVGDSRLICSLVFSTVLLRSSDGIFLVLALLLFSIVGGLLGLFGELRLGGLLFQSRFGDLGRHVDIAG